MPDLRQRFFIHQQPVRGEITHLDTTLTTILAQRDYPQAIKVLLGEMLVASTLLASTLKIEGRISIQIQSTGALKWAMAECTHTGEVRGLAEFGPIEAFSQADTQDSSAALAQLRQGVLFINIEPLKGQRYQGIVPLEQPTLAKCLIDYFNLSAQIPTHIVLGCDGQQAGGLLIQLLPRNDDEHAHIDEDLWPRLTILTNTLSQEELIHLPAQEILYRLYNEEDVRLPDAEQLKFGCTCSEQRCIDTIKQLGEDEVKALLLEHDPLEMNCQFCNQQYQFNSKQVLAMFGKHLS